MIQVNLLPPEKRPPEGTSPARLTVIIIGVLFPVLGLLMDFRYYAKTQETLNQTKQQEEANNKTQNDINAKKAITNEINMIETKTRAIKDLRSNRMLWGRFHYRFYQMMTALDTIDEKDNNVVVRRYSMKKESGDRFSIELSVEILGDTVDNMLKLQSNFMRTVDRYSGAIFTTEPRVVDLAVKLQGINPPAGLKPDEVARMSALEMQIAENKAIQEKTAAEAETHKNNARKAWSAELAPKFPNNKAQLDQAVEGMIADAEELVRINNFTGVVFDRILFKRFEQTGSPLPPPPQGMIYAHPKAAALKADFQLIFTPGKLAMLTAPKGKPAKKK